MGRCCLGAPLVHGLDLTHGQVATQARAGEERSGRRQQRADGQTVGADNQPRRVRRKKPVSLGSSQPEERLWAHLFSCTSHVFLSVFSVPNKVPMLSTEKKRLSKEGTVDEGKQGVSGWWRKGETPHRQKRTRSSSRPGGVPERHSASPASMRHQGSYLSHGP